MKFKRLIFLVTEDWYFVSHRLPLAVAARRAGYEVTVITRCGGKCDAIRAAGIEVVPFAMDRRGLNPLGLLREVWAAARLYQRLKPDLVHHVALRPVVVGGLAARLAGVRQVVSAVAGMGYAFALTPGPSPRGRGEFALTPGSSPRGRGGVPSPPAPLPGGEGGCPHPRPLSQGERGVSIEPLSRLRERGRGEGGSVRLTALVGMARDPMRRFVAFVLKALLRLPLAQGLVIVQNPDDAEAVARMGVDRARIRLIPGSGVDTERFSPRPEPEGVPVVMLASRLLWDKGVGEFVQAARRLKGRGRFVLVGAPDPHNPASVTEADLRAWREEGVIEWWGVQEDMPATLNAAHVVCLPSAYGEGMPKVLLEAMACGRPVVTTDAPGCRDCVTDGDNGLLVPVRDAQALAVAIERLLDDAALRRRMGQRGRERVVAEFSLERVIAETLGVYQEARS